MILTLEQNGRGYFFAARELATTRILPNWKMIVLNSKIDYKSALRFVIYDYYCHLIAIVHCTLDLASRFCVGLIGFWASTVFFLCGLVSVAAPFSEIMRVQTQILFKELRLSQPTWTNRWQDFGSRFLYSKLEDWISTESISSVSGFRFLHFQCCPLTFQSSTRCFQHWMMAGKHWFFFVCKPVPCSSRRSWWSTSTAWWSFVAGDCQRLPLKDLRQRYKKK